MKTCSFLFDIVLFWCAQDTALDLSNEAFAMWKCRILVLGGINLQIRKACVSNQIIAFLKQYIRVASKHVPVSSHDWVVVVLVSFALLDIRMRMEGICCKGNKLINTGLQEEFQNYSGEFHQHHWRWKSLYLVRKKQRICLCTSL